MTLPEILAAARASQATGFSEAFTDLTGAAAEERADILAAQENIKDQQEAAERQTARQETKRGRARLIGGILGGLAGAALAPLTGGLSVRAGAAIGAGLGSFGAQKAAGDLSLDNISSGLGEGMFFGRVRENISGKVQDLNRFLNEAEENFKQRQLTSAAGDALLASSIAGMGNPIDRFKSTFFKGSATGAQPLLDINLRDLPQSALNVDTSSLGDLSAISGGRFSGRGGAFDIARSLLGDNQTFNFGGRQYTTNLLGG